MITNTTYEIPRVVVENQTDTLIQIRPLFVTVSICFRSPFTRRHTIYFVPIPFDSIEKASRFLFDAGIYHFTSVDLTHGN